MSGSVSILSEAVHSGIDLIAAWFAVRESGKPADDEHNFGHEKIENVAGTIEAVIIFGAAIYIICEAVHKLINGTVEIGVTPTFALPVKRPIFVCLPTIFPHHHEDFRLVQRVGIVFDGLFPTHYRDLPPWSLAAP